MYQGAAHLTLASRSAWNDGSKEAFSLLPRSCGRSVSGLRAHGPAVNTWLAFWLCGRSVCCPISGLSRASIVCLGSMCIAHHFSEAFRVWPASDQLAGTHIGGAFSGGGLVARALLESTHGRACCYFSQETSEPTHPTLKTFPAVVEDCTIRVMFLITASTRRAVWGK